MHMLLGGIAVTFFELCIRVSTDNESRTEVNALCISDAGIRTQHSQLSRHSSIQIKEMRWLAFIFSCYLLR